MGWGEGVRFLIFDLFLTKSDLNHDLPTNFQNTTALGDTAEIPDSTLGGYYTVTRKNNTLKGWR